MLQQDTLARLLLEACTERSLRHVTIETNGTQPMGEAMAIVLNRIRPLGVTVTWSVSPKLFTNSWESIDRALRPEAVKSYLGTPDEIYLKFVVGNSQDVTVAESYVMAYLDHGAEFSEIYLMPEGGTIPGTDLIDGTNAWDDRCAEIASAAMARGWKYSPRLHMDLFGNQWGT
jgi:7-carboxy-7-deazaguanine synthase